MRFNVLCICVVFVGLCLGAVSAEAGEGLIVPYITVSEEFNDNVFFTADNQKSDFITRIAPGIKLDYESPFWHWRADAVINYLHFLGSTQGDLLYPTVTVWGNMRPVNNFLYLDVYDSYTRVPLNTASDSLFVDQANQNILTVSPYLKFHPMKRLELTIGYMYKNVFYDRSDTINWQEHDVFVRAAHEITDRSNYFVSLLYAYTITSDDFNYDRLTASMGLEYNYADRSRIYLEGGYSLLSTGGNTFSSPYWKVGINYYFNRMIASLNGEVAYNTDPRFNMTDTRSINAGLTREYQRGTIGVSAYYYSTKDYVSDLITQTGYGLTALGTRDFSDRLKGRLSLTVGRARGNAFIDNGLSFFVSQIGPYYSLITLDSRLDYALKPDLDVFFQYIHTHRLYEENSSDISNNRVIVGLTKTFRGWKF